MAVKWILRFTKFLADVQQKDLFAGLDALAEIVGILQIAISQRSARPRRAVARAANDVLSDERQRPAEISGGQRNLHAAHNSPGLRVAADIDGFNPPSADVGLHAGKRDSRQP